MIRDSRPLLPIAPIIAAMADPEGREALPTAWAWVGLISIVGIAVVARILRFEQVFLDDGTVVFAVGDAYYHAHRALYSFLAFPDFMRFDPCINWPDGAPVPHPPLHDLFSAGLARLVSDSQATFERILAWLPVAWGALTVIPVYLLGSHLRGRAMGLGAACLYALLPIAIEYSRVGNADHHAAAGLLGAILLLLYSEFLGPDARGARLVWIAAGLALTRAALLGTWHGSLLYVALGEVAIVLYGVARNRSDVLMAETASVLVSAGLAALLVAATPTPIAGPWSATELSHLHLLAFTLAAVVSTLCVALQRFHPLLSPGWRVARAGGIAGVLVLAAAGIPNLLEGLRPAFEFLTRTDDWGSSVQEQLPLFFDRGRWSGDAGEGWLGYYAYLLPFVPLAFALLADSPRLRSRALFLFAWSFVFGGLTLYQLRFGNDFAAVGCVGFALFISMGCAWLQRRTGIGARSTAALCLGIGLLLALPGLNRYLRPLATHTFSFLAAEDTGFDRGLLSIEGTQVRFAQQVSAVLPPGVGCLADDELETVPHDGILADPALGHVLHQVAHRATPSDPFGPYIGEANYRAVLEFLFSESEESALEVAGRLNTPWVATAEAGGELPEASIMRRLHRGDGNPAGPLPHLERFRLIHEGPAGGIPISVLFAADQQDAVPYKLWEIVPGAVIQVVLPPRERVEARLAVETPSGRRFVYHASAVSDAEGVANLRVPYATGATTGIRTGARYVLDSNGKRWRAKVTEAAVLNSQTVFPALDAPRN